MKRVITLVSASLLSLSLSGAAFAAADTHHEDAYKNSQTRAHTLALGGVANPKDTLVKAKVEDASGNNVGTVDDVMLDKKGKPTALKVDVGSFLGIGGKDVSMKASSFKFDPDRKVLITSMNKDQIKKLPEYKS